MKEGLRLKLRCKFALHSVQYLGHIIRYDSIYPIDDNLVAIKNSHYQKSTTARQFFGEINVYTEYRKISLTLNLCITF